MPHHRRCRSAHKVQVMILPVIAKCPAGVSTLAHECIYIILFIDAVTCDIHELSFCETAVLELCTRANVELNGGGTDYSFSVFSKTCVPPCNYSTCGDLTAHHL